MSIASEITRLTNAKTGIKIALEGKGVTVPADAKIDTYGNLVEGIEVGVDTSDADATQNDILEGKSAYVNGSKVVGSVIATEDYAEATDNLATLEASDKSYQENFNNLYFQAILPNNTVQKSPASIKIPRAVFKSNYASSLNSENIKKGIDILGVVGTLEEGTNTSDATATSNDIEQGKTAYVNGEKVTGTLEYCDIGGDGIGEGFFDAIKNAKTAFNVEFPIMTTNKCIVDGNSVFHWQYGVTQLAEGLEITADKLAKGVTILGTEGTFTSDADAVALDIEEGKTAYINGTKVIGTLPAVGSINFRGDNFYVTQMSDNKIQIKTNYSPTPADTEKFIINTTSNIYMEIPQEILANTLGITADKIKSGVTICGVTGTYTGDSTPTE